MNRLEYYNGEEHHEGFRIGASGVSRFFTSTSSWFRENMLGEDGFTGSTASVLGTIVHGLLEAYVTKNPLPQSEINEYLISQSSIVPDLDVYYIQQQYPLMAAVAIEYLMYELDESCVAERFIHKELLPGIHVGGSIDLHSSNSVTDYKTTSAKYPPKSIAYSWKLQLLTYAKLLIDEGHNIQYIRVISISTYVDGGVSEKTGKPLKSYPPTVTVLEEAITQDDLDMISGIHQVIAESVQTFRDNPAMRHLLAQDARLRGCSCIYTTPEEEEI